MRTTLSPLSAAILASLVMAAAPAFAQQEGSTGASGGSAGHHPPLPTHLPREKPKPKTAQTPKGAPAQAQPAQATPAAAPAAAVVVIDTASTYEDALNCYQFHGVTMQIANAMKARTTISDNQRAQYESVAKLSGYLQSKWFQRIGQTSGGKTPAQMNTDLQTIAGGIVVDANAGLGGDAAAQERNNVVRNKCKGFEKVEEAAAAPGAAAAPADPATPAKPPG